MIEPKEIDNCISIHAPVKGATLAFSIQSATYCDFNPRPREGSDCIFSRFDSSKLISIHAPVKGATSAQNFAHEWTTISIHAPVKGATYSYRSSFVDVVISIHAPVKGATILIFHPHHSSEHFNPRPREGSDLRILKRN